MRRTLIAVALATAVFAGCGGDDDESESAATPAPTETATEAPASSGSGGGETLAFSAPEDGSLNVDQGSEVTAKAGKVTVTFNNPSSVPHAVEIEGNGVEEETETVTGSEAPPLEVDLKPGTYEFYCPVGGHTEAGMKGTLKVE
jgi:plastocyanin